MEVRTQWHRPAPILLIGFGLLIALIALTGAGALKRARDSYRDLIALNDRYRHTERTLDTVRTSIYVGRLLARDYLLDPSNIRADSYRTRLVEQRSTMQAAFQELQTVIPDDHRSHVEKLRHEEEIFWSALEPLLEWTADEKRAQNWWFLSREILPRREAALQLAHELSQIAQANLDRQRREVDSRQEELAVFIRRMLAATVFVGFAIAAATFFRMRQLESRSAESHRRTEAAESQLRRLSRQLVRAQEEERRSISRELHDEVGQMLTALRMEVRSLQDLRTSPENEFNEHVDSAKRLAEQSLRSLRDIAMGLRPSMLDDLGLGSAIQWQARQFSKRAGIPVNVHIDGLPAALPDRHRTCVYRLVQEALTNCARHSQARTIDVNVTNHDGRLSVAVKDDGVGFDPAKVKGRGLGLLGIEERVLELGGDLRVTSQPHRGSALYATIPIEKETA